jgi:hypothetical protein
MPLVGSLASEQKTMRMNFGEVLKIEDLGKHSAVTVIRLGIALAGTVNVTPDPKRKNFYDVEGGSSVYYIYVSPISGRIALIATWNNVAQRMSSPNVAEPDLFPTFVLRSILDGREDDLLTRAG